MTISMLLFLFISCESPMKPDCYRVLYPYPGQSNVPLDVVLRVYHTNIQRDSSLTSTKTSLTIPQTSENIPLNISFQEDSAYVSLYPQASLKEDTDYLFYVPEIQELSNQTTSQELPHVISRFTTRSQPKILGYAPYNSNSIVLLLSEPALQGDIEQLSLKHLNSLSSENFNFTGYAMDQNYLLEYSITNGNNINMSPLEVSGPSLRADTTQEQTSFSYQIPRISGMEYYSALIHNKALCFDNYLYDSTWWEE